MANTRLTVVVRKDLQMPEGLLAAQVCHMADAFMRDKIEKAVRKSPKSQVSSIFTKEEAEWMSDPYISILAVNTYEDLCEITKHAEREGLPLFEWNDLVPSPTIENEAIKAFVGVAIGPADFDAIKIVTGALKSY